MNEGDPLLGETVRAQLIVRVAARATFPNCPRYIPVMHMTEPSPYALPSQAPNREDPPGKPSMRGS